MATLNRDHRKQLESTVVAARKAAEEGDRKALEELAVHHHEPWPTLSPEQRKLRNRLRAHGRQLGDRQDAKGIQSIERLKGECAYEHWHRMLFARFLAESDLLIEPESGVSITLEDCRELARERGVDWLALASDFAVRMLSQIFRAGDPVLEIALPLETRQALEKLLKSLPRDVFLADDSLGWVYQFWQSEEKDTVNKSEVKIGADELPAVTQLFTEDYMVLFLLHNTLGAWWAGKVLERGPDLAARAANEDELRTACSVGGIQWTYLRFIREDNSAWRPAASIFEGWPRAAKDIAVLDPCMGSGHFLVSALPLLVAIRREEEGLTPKQAVEAVLRENLFGLEIDPRCTQIAAFNLAFAAWRMVGHRSLPPLNMACSGLGINAKEADWLKLAGQNDRVQRAMSELYRLFGQAPVLGSLINPRRLSGGLLTAHFDEVASLLENALAVESADDNAKELAVTAQGLIRAGGLLRSHFTLVCTNVPYLGRGKQDSLLKAYCERAHPDAKTDLATCFIERCLDFCCDTGATALVTPQNWFFLPGYKQTRARMLRERRFELVVRLGANAFADMNFWAATTALTIMSATRPCESHITVGIDASGSKERNVKKQMLSQGLSLPVQQASQLRNPDARISMETPSVHPLLAHLAMTPQGIKTGDDGRFRRNWWEIEAQGDRWRYLQGAPDITRSVDGAWYAVDYAESGSNFARLQGLSVWDRPGIVVKLMGGVTAARYFGCAFDSNVTAIVPRDTRDLLPLWMYASSPEFERDLRKIEPSVKVNNATVGKVPFDSNRWQQAAADTSSDTLFVPHSNDPTQWLFDGQLLRSDQPLQVAVARLLGFCWPRQSGRSFTDCPATGPDRLVSRADEDGIVCLRSIKGEVPAADRLRALLADAYGSEWSSAKQVELLVQVGYASTTLQQWLRDGFFEQHCEVFHNRPFIWHIWDGRNDGFHALINYHKLVATNGGGLRTLEKLVYSYLGDWIERQRADQKNGIEGADARLAAAQHLQAELKKIEAGEPPYDIFVRWKPLHEQPIGWEPDINDGVRINIRPFMTARPLNAKGKNACILRVMPKIKWDKDRGKEPHRPKADYPWFWSWDEAKEDFAGGRDFDGNRWNDLHYSRKFKQEAREREAARAKRQHA